MDVKSQPTKYSGSQYHLSHGPAFSRLSLQSPKLSRAPTYDHQTVCTTIPTWEVVRLGCTQFRKFNEVHRVTSDLSPISSFPERVSEWAALRTAARWEKQLAARLTAAHVPVFLPLMARVSNYAGKRRITEVPIFGGYVFCSAVDFIGNQQLGLEVRSKVAQVLRPSDPRLLRTELKTIADLLTNRHLIQERFIAGVGDAVRIVDGSWRGHQGKVVRTKANRYRLVLEISFIGARREVEIEERMIERDL